MGLASMKNPTRNLTLALCCLALALRLWRYLIHGLQQKMFIIYHWRTTLGTWKQKNRGKGDRTVRATKESSVFRVPTTAGVNRERSKQEFDIFVKLGRATAKNDNMF